MTTSRRTPTTLAVYPLRPPAAIQCLRITPRKACPAPHPTVNLPAHGYGTVRNGSFLLLTPPSRPCRRKSTTTSRTHTHIRNKYNISSPNNSRTNPPGPNESPENHPPQNRQYICLEPGCSSTAQHTRAADLARHQRTVHRITERFDCPRTRCTRKGERAFSRSDHLLEHLRSYHGEDIPKGEKRGSRH